MQYFGFDRPSFGIKTFGFGESSPKLQADFTTGTYKASGAAKTFADLFTFTRAGKAWLVKDTGLQEYAADIPRLDDGLLIEQSATNLLSSTTGILLTGLTISGSATKEDLSDGFHYLDSSLTAELGSIYALSTTVKNNGVNRFSLTQTLGGNRSVFLNIPSGGIAQSALEYGYTHTLHGQYNRLSAPFKAYASGIRGLRLFYSRLYDGANYNDAKYKGDGASSLHIINMQAEIGQLTTSPIPTTTSPVTRPADFLLNKITGTAVTGDWDSTLTLSIVAGQLVHSGYGRIRSLEIN